ncbi:DotA/TraY family protein [Undibacterium sp. Xuan67W]|uniref:DotA/TraY family protein n=1 Tax=Undibacterium sp. Xuan67W TaxID=3413057 RepID=UPI003BEFB119
MKKILYSILALLMPSVALATTVGPFVPPDTDVSMKVLAALFGNIGTFGASGSDAFGPIMQILNSAILIIGGIFATYTILAGTIGTAHDGEMLGKKFSSVWIPIRYSLSTAMVLPIINGQYAIFNWIVTWCLVQGIGLADLTWAKYMSVSSLQNQMTVGITPPQATALGYKVFGSLACMRGYEKLLKSGNNAGMIDPILMPNEKPPAVGITKTQTWNQGSTIYQFGMTEAGLGFNPSSCGTMTVKNTETPTVAKTDSASVLGLLGDPNLYLQSAYKSAEQNKEAAAILVTSLDTAAKAWIDNTASDPSPSIDQAVATYQNTIKTNAAQITSSFMNLKELEESAKRDGWAFAGAYYMKISYLVDLSSRTTATIPTASGMKADSNKYLGAFMTQYGEGLKNLKMADKEIGDFSINKESNTGGEEWSWMGWLSSGFDLTRLMKHFIQGVGTFVLDDGSNPILEMKRLGNWLLGVAATMQAGYSSGSYAIATAAPGVAGPLALTQSFQPMFMTILPLMIGVGFTLSFILPMMPFMLWMGVFIGWLIMAVEAIVISTMWGVYHLHPNGDDLTGKGSSGYSLLLSLMFRPVFAVIGLIASINIIYVLGTLINKIFSSAFLLSQTDSNIFIMILSLIAFPLIYCGMMWTIITKCMKVISSIADDVLKWFGGQGGSLGQSANELGSSNAGSFIATGIAAKTAGGHLAGSMQRGKEHARSELEKINAVGGFEKHKNDLDKKFGDGAGDMKATALGLNTPQDFARNQAASSAYDEGLEIASSVGGEAGVDSFQQQMLDASQNGFSEHGSAQSAAKSFGRDIAMSAATQKAEKEFGPEGAAYLQQASMRKNSKGQMVPSISQANNAMKFLAGAKANLGDNFSQVVNTAVEESDNPQDMQQFIQSNFKNEEVVQEEVKQEVKQETEDKGGEIKED